MADIRHYEAEIDLMDIAAAVELRLRNAGFVTQSYPQSDGYIVSAKKTDTARMVAGLGREATITLMPSKGGFVATVDKGTLLSQVIGGALGYAFFVPLMGLAGYGLYRRHKLSDEVFGAIDYAIAQAHKPRQKSTQTKAKRQ